MKKKGVIKVKTIQYFALLVYIIAMSGHQLSTGIDPWIARISFALLVGSSILLRKKIKINKEIIWIIIFWTYFFMSLIWASNQHDTMLCLNSAIQVIALSFCLPNIIENKEDIENILKIIIISLLYTSLLLVIKTPPSLWGMSRIGSATGLHQNSMGIRLATGVVLCVYFISNYKHTNKKKIFFYIVCLTLFLIITFFTGSKKAIAIILVGIALYEVLSNKGIKSLKKIVEVGTVVFLTFFIIMNNEGFYKVLGRRIEVFFETSTQDNNTDFSLIERNYFIQEAKGLFEKHPIIGYGGGNFVSYMREIGYSHVTYSHNNFFELLSTLGIIGFLLYYSLWIIILIDLFNSFRKNNAKLVLLFLVIIFINIILDYWHVTYYSDFHILLLILANLAIKNNNNEKILKGDS